MPRARSSESAPVGTASMAMVPFSPIFMTEPLPNCFSIWPRAMSRFFCRSTGWSCPAVVRSGAAAGRRWPGPVSDLGGVPPDTSGHYGEGVTLSGWAAGPPGNDTTVVSNACSFKDPGPDSRRGAASAQGADVDVGVDGPATPAWPAVDQADVDH